MFARENNSVFSNLVNVSDARRLLKKGKWRQGREASYPHITDRDSESDTDLEEEAFLRVEPNKHYKARSEVQKRIFMKKRVQAKAGANNFVEVTRVIVKETPHTFTLVNGKVVRKNEKRKCLDTPEPPVGTFGTPCKLLRERVFVHPENTKKHEQWLARETRKRSQKRAAYKAKRWAEKQQRSSPTEVESTEKLKSSEPRTSTRQRRAVDKSGGVPICSITTLGTKRANSLRVRAGVRSRATAAFLKWTRNRLLVIGHGCEEEKRGKRE